MQSFGDLFANNRLLAIGIVLAAVAVILAVGVALFRLVFGRRLHMSGGRTRQPRLGVVDAFDLDRQRQLVLIRRDNVEHLLMIGGPNDVVIEAAIVRAPAALAGREKDNGFTPSVGIPAPMAPQAALPPTPVALPAAASAPAGGPEGGPNMPIPAPTPLEPRLGPAPEPVRPAQPIEPAPVAPPAQPTAPPPETRLPATATLPPAGPRPVPTGPRPVSTMPPRPPVTPVSRGVAAPTPRTNLSRATPVAPPTNESTGEARQPGRVEPVVGRAPPEAPTSPERTVPEPNREAAAPMRFPPPRMPRVDEPSSSPSPSTPENNRPNVATPAAQPAASQDAPVSHPLPRPAAPPRPAPPAAAQNRGVPPRPVPTGPAPAATPPTPAQPRAPLPSLSSLEEEMAKLLGRPMPPSDSSGSGA